VRGGLSGAAAGNVLARPFHNAWYEGEKETGNAGIQQSVLMGWAESFEARFGKHRLDPDSAEHQERGHDH